MTQLAMKSEGNHFFAQTADDLRRGFDLEFSIGLSVVAKEIVVEVECAEGVRPIRVLNSPADITGQRVVAQLNQLYSGRETYLLLEVEVPAAEVGQQLEVAKVGMSYANMQTRATDKVTRSVGVRFTDSSGVVERNTDRKVMEAVVLMLANEKYKLALEMRDQGRTDEARRLLRDNESSLNDYSRRYKSKTLRDFGQMNGSSADNLAPGQWKAERKRMRDRQIEFDSPSEAF